MSRQQTFRGRLLAWLLAATTIGGCASVSSSSTAVATATSGPTAAMTRPATPVATPTTIPTLPGGLSTRVGGPPLVGGEVAACIPDCLKGRVAGGTLPAGRYQTVWFFGGYMTIDTDGTWQRTEDSDGELSLPITGSGDDTYRVAFFLDPVLVVDDVIQTDVPRRAADYVAWLSKRSDLHVSPPMSATIGSVPALAVDIRLAPNARSTYDDCPQTCVTFFKVPAFDHSDGILGDDVYRMYFADVTYSGSNHLLGVKVEGRDGADLEAQLVKVEALLATVVVPARPTTPDPAGT